MPIANLERDCHGHGLRERVRVLGGHGQGHRQQTVPVQLKSGT